ncbi:MAG: hypothetical protein AB7G39_06750 [Alphaproteobacteria bacterium]
MSQPLRKSAVQLPTTFVQRGTAVPFSSEGLEHARMRVSGDGEMEALVPGLAGGRSVYVIPWQVLPEIIPMTVHDRKLHETLFSRRPHAPHELRACSLDVAKSGVGGIKLATEARNVLASEAAHRLATQCTLLAGSIRQLAADKAKKLDLSVSGLSRAEGLLAARAALKSVAGELGVQAEDIYARIERWAEVVHPLGPPGAEYPGHLRSTIQQLDRFVGEVRSWAAEEPPESAMMAQECVMVCADVLDSAKRCESEVDGAAEDMQSTLRAWDATVALIRSRIDRLAWVLDGWDRVVTIWDAKRDRPAYERREAMETIFRFLPVLPEEALRQNGRTIWTRFQENRRRRIQANQSWFTGEDDEEMLRRLNVFQTEPA